MKKFSGSKGKGLLAFLEKVVKVERTGDTGEMC